MEYGTVSSDPRWLTWINKLGKRVWCWDTAGKAIAVSASDSVTLAEVSSALKELASLLSGKPGVDTDTTAILDATLSSTNSDTTSDWDTHVHPFQ